MNTINELKEHFCIKICAQRIWLRAEVMLASAKIQMGRVFIKMNLTAR